MNKDRFIKLEDKITAIHRQNYMNRYKLNLSIIPTNDLYNLLDENTKITNIVYYSEVDKAYFISEDFSEKLELKTKDYNIAPYGGEDFLFIPKIEIKEGDLNRVDTYVFSFINNI
jgi:hypothetical protein